ncbi:TetR/AcrR family transcriptional regulator [Paracidovorax wautersii]|uniref:TetR/AcrR family transcriptional regulator n=1 Tax=Paracidovorax wautersii TaxID=1177982 RepID=A0ABU1IFT1_9BURK|nr:TetR/AcrR family transcriptional regulator [Paracidovorax wautersii]MDR6215642.1 TetR/AcrR family transcriptional regulator [Paracidovorax wautersii]
MPSSSPSSAPATEAAPKRGRRKEARPGELLSAALDLFVEKGFAATKVEEVAARAGVSKGTLFLYFPSKEELFKEVVRRNIADRFVEWDLELEAYEDNTSELLRYCFATWWEHVGATKAGALDKLMLSEANNFPELARFYRQEVVEPARDLVRRILQRGMERGEFRRMDLEYAVYLVEAPLAFLMMWQHSFGLCMPDADRFSPQEYIRVQVDNILLGLATRPA